MKEKERKNEKALDVEKKGKIERLKIGNDVFEGSEKVLEGIEILRYDIETAKSDFVKNADAFIENKGKNWYFCKCKQDKKKDCLGITTIYLYGILFSMEFYQGSTSSVLIIYSNITFHNTLSGQNVEKFCSFNIEIIKDI